MELDFIRDLFAELAGLTLVGGHNLLIVQLHDGQRHHLLLKSCYLLLLLALLLLQKLQRVMLVMTLITLSQGLQAVSTAS